MRASMRTLHNDKSRDELEEFLESDELPPPAPADSQAKWMLLSGRVDIGSTFFVGEVDRQT
jgi:hypothetical protein